MTDLKLSEAAQICGVGLEVLQLLISGDLLRQVVRSARGHSYIPDDQVPTWQQCRALVEHRRDHHLRRASELVTRIAVEIEAVQNDITESREHPTEPLGVDLLAATTYASTGRGQPATTLSAAQLSFERMQIEQYHRALRRILDTHPR